MAECEARELPLFVLLPRRPRWNGRVEPLQRQAARMRLQAARWLLLMNEDGRMPRNPFRPGFGAMPPHLAGRGEVQDDLRAGVDAIADGDSAPPNNFAILAPRGTGKTALLGWLEQELAGRGGLSCIRLEGADLGSAEELMRATLGPSASATLREEISSQRSIGKWAELPRIAGAEESRGERGRIEREIPPLSPFEWRRRFCEKLGGVAGEPSNPLVMLADEAHTADLQAMRQLFVAIQQAQNRNLPVLLVIAGTPDLRDRLGDAGTTFWNRLGPDGDIQLRPLRDEDAARAILKPMRSSPLKCEVAPEALADALEDAQGHPYFLQTWGYLLFKDAAAHPPSDGRIGTDAVERVRAKADQSRKALYADRYMEIQKLRLTAACEAFCRAMLASIPPGAGDRLMRLEEGAARRAVREAFAESPDDALAEGALTSFRHLGLAVLDMDGLWHPGIPSFIRYSAERAKKELAQESRA